MGNKVFANSMDKSFVVPTRDITLKKYEPYGQGQKLWEDVLHCAKEVPTLKFNASKNGWEAVTLSLDDIEVSPSRIDYLKVVTYNIWFDSKNFDERAEHLFYMFDQSDADFICLQEVTSKFMMMIIQQKWVQKGYFIARNEFSRYGLMVLSKWPCVFKEVSFNSEMGRTLIVAETRINGEQVVVSSSHLESLGPNKQYRINQLDQTFSFLKQYDNSIFMGDCNFSEGYEENQSIPENFIDLWKNFNDLKENPGETMPATRHYPAWRPDHILVKNSTLWEPHQIDRIGYEIISKYGEEAGQSTLGKIRDEVKTPSDHYGLVATVKLN